jgi:signal transduction histidine kinase
MVEIRVAVADDTRVPGLMRRLAGLFDRSSLSFDRSRKEVRVNSEWESRSVAQVVDAVAAWLAEDGGDSATLSVGNRSYTMAGSDAEAALMSGLVVTPATTLQLVRQMSSRAGDTDSPNALLEAVCESLLGLLALDRISGLRYRTRPREVSEVAVAGLHSTSQAGRRPIASVPLLAEALESESLVSASEGAAGEAAWRFALPLICGERCLGFLSGQRRRAASPGDGELEALATVGIVVAALLASAVARERAERLNGLKSEFVALAAHELRGPLSTIYGICATLDERAEAFDAAARRRLRRLLREQSARMHVLVEQLLDLSRFDLAAIEVAPEPVRLRSKIEELVRVAKGTRDEAVNIEVAPDLEAVIDPMALDRMLSNLLANALRHGEPPVTVTAARRDAHLRLAVEDRGEGVPREFVANLFDRFTRSEKAQVRADGTGLGLAIARAYARAHGGDIVYEPATPHGARFEVVLPLRPDAAALATD